MGGAVSGTSRAVGKLRFARPRRQARVDADDSARPVASGSQQQDVQGAGRDGADGNDSGTVDRTADATAAEGGGVCAAGASAAGAIAAGATGADGTGADTTGAGATAAGASAAAATATTAAYTTAADATAAPADTSAADASAGATATADMYSEADQPTGLSAPAAASSSGDPGRGSYDASVADALTLLVDEDIEGEGHALPSPSSPAQLLSDILDTLRGNGTYTWAASGSDSEGAGDAQSGRVDAADRLAQSVRDFQAEALGTSALDFSSVRGYFVGLRQRVLAGMEMAESATAASGEEGGNDGRRVAAEQELAAVRRRCGGQERRIASLEHDLSSAEAQIANLQRSAHASYSVRADIAAQNVTVEVGLLGLTKKKSKPRNKSKNKSKGKRSRGIAASTSLASRPWTSVFSTLLQRLLDWVGVAQAGPRYGHKPHAGGSKHSGSKHRRAAAGGSGTRSSDHDDVDAPATDIVGGGNETTGRTRERKCSSTEAGVEGNSSVRAETSAAAEEPAGELLLLRDKLDALRLVLDCREAALRALALRLLQHEERREAQPVEAQPVEAAALRGESAGAVLAPQLNESTTPILHASQNASNIVAPGPVVDSASALSLEVELLRAALSASSVERDALLFQLNNASSQLFSLKGSV
ncbi:hypothetical protein B484DRAFT_441134 [Ochromonadaceae sp. CCMP2298]|nr:hypothetical protein B484DRAFT_441134 [Ochromonadaceae sp. CCMP2298]